MSTHVLFVREFTQNGMLKVTKFEYQQLIVSLYYANNPLRYLKLFMLHFYLWSKKCNPYIQENSSNSPSLRLTYKFLTIQKMLFNCYTNNQIMLLRKIASYVITLWLNECAHLFYFFPSNSNTEKEKQN